jgi:hypothetical protein
MEQDCKSAGKGKMGPIFIVTSLNGGEWKYILHILSHLILFASCVCIAVEELSRALQ